MKDSPSVFTPVYSVRRGRWDWVPNGVRAEEPVKFQPGVSCPDACDCHVAGLGLLAPGKKAASLGGWFGGGPTHRPSQLNAISKEKGADPAQELVEPLRIWQALHTQKVYLVKQRGTEKYTGRKTQLITHVTA